MACRNSSLLRSCASRHAGGRLQVQDRRVALAEQRALIRGRQKTGAVVLDAAQNLLVVLHDDEGRQVLIRAAQAVRHPGAHRRTAGQDLAGVHLADRAHVIDAVGLAGAKHGDVVHVLGDVRQPVGNPQAALAVLLERVARGIKPVMRGAKSALQCFRMIRRRHRLPGIFHQRGLGIEQIDMAGRAFHEAPDDGLGARRDVRFLGRQRIDARWRRTHPDRAWRPARWPPDRCRPG